jgi:hypothetical protein
MLHGLIAAGGRTHGRLLGQGHAAKSKGENGTTKGQGLFQVHVRITPVSMPH